MLSLCKFVKSVCVSAVLTSSLTEAGFWEASHSSHSNVCVDLSLYFIVLLFKLWLLLLLLAILVFSVNLSWTRVNKDKDYNSPEYWEAFASTIDMCRWIFSFWLQVVTVTMTVDIIEEEPVAGGLLSPLQRFAVIMLWRTLRSGRTRIM